MNIQKKAFTLAELIVSISIVVILASIGFYSYVGYLTEARDSNREANVGEIRTSLKLYKQQRGAYPLPGNSFNITNSGIIVAFQGKLNENVILSTMEEIPLDPYTKLNYFYSVTKNRQEFQISLTLENGDFPIALLNGDYKTVSKNVLPSIMLSTGATVGSSVEIHTGVVLNGSTNRDLFILDGSENLPYSIDKPHIPYYAGTDIDEVLIAGDVNFWQNSDYRNCDEINESAKYIHESGEEEYQILNTSGVLTNTGCTLP